MQSILQLSLSHLLSVITFSVMVFTLFVRNVCIQPVSFAKHSVEFCSRFFVRNVCTTGAMLRHPGIRYPYPLSHQWAVRRVIDPDQYTIEALPLVRTGGRGPDGIIKYKHRTTGLNRPWFMVDYNYSRHLSTGQVHEEIVLKIVRNWWRTPFLALVASGEVKRWIVATKNMQPGDIVRSHVEIPFIPVSPREGDAHPVGALPAGTTVCLVELRPGEGALRCRAAGTSATIIRRGKLVGDMNAPIPQTTADVTDEQIVVLRDNGTKKLMRLLPECMVVVGQVSNTEHNKEKYSKFGEKYWHGIKQRSGLWQRKTGRFGRKIRPLGPPLDFVLPTASSGRMVIKCTLPETPEFDRQKERELFAALNPRSQKPIQPVPKPYNGLPDRQPRFCWSSWTSVR
ncbi:39S ribosomal protein L2 mitochondrial [Paragonimus heterotremus]|uniref:39S ribosomal protein L2 mitochondrial n=1 Tax=Paragonimus heterotremus TaxID=100268 RepID=A0A8J4TLT0_9TREM|nr:39S ribosomal protein L2 mitochondrial [Paragonimus heterotremus]